MPNKRCQHPSGHGRLPEKRRTLLGRGLPRPRVFKDRLRRWGVAEAPEPRPRVRERARIHREDHPLCTNPFPRFALDLGALGDLPPSRGDCPSDRRPGRQREKHAAEIPSLPNPLWLLGASMTALGNAECNVRLRPPCYVTVGASSEISDQA